MDLTPTTATIRALTCVDAEPYRAMMLDAFQLHPDAFTSSVGERSALPLAWWQERLAGSARKADGVIGAFDAEGLCGVAGVSFDTRERAAHKATLFGMYVRPRQRRGGIGHALVQAVLARSRSTPGVRLVQLTVTQGNDAAQRLYEQCGFNAFGVEPFAVRVTDTFVSKVHMWCDLGNPDLSRDSQ